MINHTNSSKLSLAAICILRRKECWSYIDTLVSDSPIIQNGKLIGAVTHVFVDDCTKGYGIFAENMLNTAQSVPEEKLKEAS